MRAQVQLKSMGTGTCKEDISIKQGVKKTLLGKLKYEYNQPNAKMEHCKLARELQESIGKGKHMAAGYRSRDGTNQGARWTC